MPIPLSTFLPIETPSQYKVHLACWNGESQPLDVFVRDRTEWDGWNKWRSSKDEFNREFILSLIAREVFWKEALLTRIPLGYNKN